MTSRESREDFVNEKMQRKEMCYVFYLSKKEKKYFGVEL